ncbi:uncharacterized protein LOC131254225 [Magnolia sinica]|uniref:uncharacterized protein LOC131254225 n=1 Tax=Magnolia sinica TaxID=86752 RepID=UPI0026590547|nr:uncharacterized protein LOC131254225 [Magnolia sinica]
MQRVSRRLQPHRIVSDQPATTDTEQSAASPVLAIGVEEDQNHLFSHGMIVVSVWEHFSNIFGVNYLSSQSVLQRFNLWISKASKKIRVSRLVGLVPSVISWEIWLSRNQARFEGRAMSASKIISKVAQWLHDIACTILGEDRNSLADSITLQLINIPKAECHLPRNHSIVTWLKPLRGFLKLNVDGSSRGNPGLSGGRGVCRDHHGNLIFAFHRNYGLTLNTIAEAQAMLNGITSYSKLGLRSIIVESDSLTIAKAAADRYDFVPWNIWYKIGTIREFRRSLNLSFSHIFREGNSVADALTRLASEGNPNNFFVSKYALPVKVQGALLLDQAGLRNLQCT